MISGIYKITCMGNNKIYIGSSQNINKRIKTHFNQLNRGDHGNPHMQSTYNKYGFETFTWEVIEECHVLLLLTTEQKWMDATKCYDRSIGFNNTTKAGSQCGYKHTEECKRRMSALKKGKSLSTEHIEKIRFSNTGKTRTDEYKQKMSEMRIGSKNPRWGVIEETEHKELRMENMLKTPRWNKGLTIASDPRLKKLGFWAGKVPPNGLLCKLIDKETGLSWTGDTLKGLSLVCPISLSTINRLRAKTAGELIKQKYRLEIL